MYSRAEKHARFLEAHKFGHPLIMPNAWDAGSARIIAETGFAALATTSAGHAFARGVRDELGNFSREHAIANAAEIVNAVTLPVSADLQDGFGRTPDECAQTIDEAIAVGLVGGSIEDATTNTSEPILETAAAVDRITAAAESSAGKNFVLTARAENLVNGRENLTETVDRLQRYSAAGADVLFAPGLKDLEAIRIVCREVDKPVNVVVGFRGPAYTVAQVAEAGAARISVGGSLARAALGALRRAVQEIKNDGTFEYLNGAFPGTELSAIMDVRK